MQLSGSGKVSALGSSIGDQASNMERGPVVVELLPYEHPATPIADVDPVQIIRTIAFYSRPQLQARCADNTANWRNFVDDIDMHVFSSLAELEYFTLSSWRPSIKHLVKHDLVLKTKANNTEAFFQAMKMQDEVNAKFVWSDQLVDPKNVAKFGQRRGLWLSAAQYDYFVCKS